MHAVNPAYDNQRIRFDVRLFSRFTIPHAQFLRPVKINMLLPICSVFTVYLSVNLSICCVSKSVCVCLCLLSVLVCLSVYLSVCLSVCLLDCLLDCVGTLYKNQVLQNYQNI